MTSLNGAAMLRLTSAAIALAAPLAAPVVAQAAAIDLFYERTVMTAADARCGLFAPPLGSALNAARAQARGAALRSGVETDALAAAEMRAVNKARVVDCRSKDINVAAGRVRTAFDGFQKLIVMTYPGDTADWKADRSFSKFGAVWALSQTTNLGWDKATVGVVSGENALTAVATFADGARPYAARLVIRDVRRAPQPYLVTRQADASGHMPLAARIPPAGALRTINADQKTVAPETLLPDAGRKGAAKSGWAFRFPASAIDALSGLDPREAVAVDFVIAGRNGDIVRRAYVEIGDFAAGRAFVQTAAR